MRGPLALLALLVAGCGGTGGAPAPDAAPAAPPAPATPVTAGRVARATLPVIVSGPGRTDATEKQEVRAPFTGTLLDLTVTDGDHVRGGQVVGTMIARNSQAALEGARAMQRGAVTPQQRADAARAVQLAERGAVTAKLRAPEDGVVLSHQADEGAQLAQGGMVLEIIALDSFVFIANIAQTDLRLVHAGQPVTIDLPAAPGPVHGRVHALIPGGSPTDLTAPVRIDCATGEVPRALNLFGTAHVVVSEHRDVLVVPAPAVLRDDVTGVTRVATVTAQGAVHWVDVTTGVSARGLVEITAPPLPLGAPVVTSGQVGLPEGARVPVEP